MKKDFDEVELETKDLGESFKDVDLKSGIVCGYFSHFGSKDSDGDVIMPGAFTKTISEVGPDSKHPRIKHLLDHDKKKAVAKILILKEDAVGLYYESKIGTHTNGVDFLKMVESEIITEHSIGFETIKENHKDGNNYMTELKLWEGSSLQCWGANMNTPITGVKNLSSKISALTKALRHGTFTDEAFIELEAQLKELNQAYKDLSKPVAVTEPIELTQKNSNPDVKALEIIKSFRKGLV